MIPAHRNFLKPLPEEQWDASLWSVRDQLGTVLNVHRVMALHPELMTAWAPLRRHVATAGSFDPRLRELAILRVATRVGVEYEWHHHVARGLAAGLTNDEINAVRSNELGGLHPDEALLVAAVDELLDDLELTDATLHSLEPSIGAEGVLDIVVTVGVYVTLAMLIKTAGVEVESD